MERLDKIISATGKKSRREVKELVRQGRILVDGKVANAADMKVDPACSEILMDGENIGYEKFTYIMLHKPAGVLSAVEDRKQKTGIDLLPEELQRRGLSPVGRLDKDTEGLLLLTNDGELTHKLLRQPNAYELAEHMGAEVEDVLLALEMRGASRPASLDFTPENEDEDAPISAFLGAEERGYSDFENLETIRTAMAQLDEKQREVIRLRFFENMSQRDVAARLDRSQMSVSRVERKALELMKTALAGTED